MSDRYRLAYGPDTPYANVVELVARHRRPGGGVVVDVGCGYGAVAEPLRELDVDYLGVDLAADGLADLESRGFETVEADLTDTAGWLEEVMKAAAGRSLAAVLALDIIEHLATPEVLIAGLRELVEQAGPAPLVVCMPNVAHLDLGVKLLLGRWEVTPTGLLDATHVSLYTEARLTGDLARAGWQELDRADFHLSRSDQHQPEDCVPLSPATALGALLRQIREGADGNATVNQFVRAYAPAPFSEQIDWRQQQTGGDEPGGEPPFLSVIVRTQGTRSDTLAETLLSLAAQTCQDFEVLLMAHDVDPGGRASLRELVGSFPPGPVASSRLIQVRGGGRARPLNAGVVEARGRYVAILDDDDLAFAHWVDSFQRVARAHPGQIVRTGVARQPVGRLEHAPTPTVTALDGTACFPATFDLPGHLFENATPQCGLAFPRSCFRDLGLRFSEHLPVLEDWDMLLRASQYCGVVPTGEVTGLYRQWDTEPNSLNLHSQDEWIAAKAAILAGLESRPFLLSGESLSQLRRVLDDRRRLEAAEASSASRIGELEQSLLRLRLELAATQAQAGALDQAREDAEARYDEVKMSRSWRAAGVLRGAGRMARRVKRILGS